MSRSVPISHGLFVAMSNGKVFHYCSWDDVAVKRAPNGFIRP
jgi:hypothetical protein